MKKYLFLALSIFALMSCSEDDSDKSLVKNTTKENDWTKQSLIGQVIHYDQIIYKDGAKEGDNTQVESAFAYDFNNEGMITNAISKQDYDITLNDRRIVYTYDSNNNMTKESYYFQDETECTYLKQYKYNGKQELIEELSGKKREFPNCNKTTYSYDKNSRLIKQTFFNEKGEKHGYLKYTYIDGGFKMEAFGQGNKNDKTFNSPQGYMIFKYHNKFKSKEIYRESLMFDYDDDPKGILSFDDKNTCEYDDKGLLIKRTDYSDLKTIYSTTTYTYEYDTKGNWIKQIGTTDKNVVTFAVRKYTYFE